MNENGSFGERNIVNAKNEDDDRLVLVHRHSGGEAFCLGIFKDFHQAVGYMMERIWDFQTSYEDDGDEFSYTPPMVLEGGAGWFVRVTYRAHCWKKAESDIYYILEGTEK